MIKSSMEEDLRRAAQAAPPDSSPSSPSPEKAVPSATAPASSAADPDVIEDDYAGNLAYLKNRAESGDTAPQPELEPQHAAKNIAVPEEVQTPASETIRAETAPGLPAVAAPAIEKIPEPEDALPSETIPGAEPVTSDVEEPAAVMEKVLPSSPELTGEMEPDGPRPLAGEPASPPSANMAQLQKNLGGVVPQKKIRLGANRNFLLIFVLIVLLIALSVFLWQRRSEEAATFSSGTKESAPVDAFADVRNRNDATRMQNLTTLANLLAVYHLEEKADLPLSADYVKLDEDNPVSEFVRQALRRYGKSEELLRDPAGAGNYYAYRSSDGMSFELSAKLEDRASNGCSSDPCLFQKTIRAEDLAIMSLDTEQYK